MNELEKTFYEAMRNGRNAVSENEVYEVKLVKKHDKKENEIPSRLVIKNVLFKFKRTKVKVTVPYELFLTNGGLDASSVSVICSAISVLYTPATLCKALSF